jgi:hypothetical protein
VLSEDFKVFFAAKILEALFGFVVVNTSQKKLIQAIT